MLKSILFIFLFLNLGCSKEEITYDEDVELIVVLGHTYRWDAVGNKVDKNIESADYSKYSQKWLLGDLCSETVMDPHTIVYLDSLFDLTSDNTLWSVGNHDLRNGDFNLITKTTQKPFNYSIERDSNAYYVLNTQINHEQLKDSCEYKKKQYNDFKSFLNKISEYPNDYKNLFILSHNTIWANLEPPLTEYELIGNVRSHGMDFKCTAGSQFEPNFGNIIKTIQSKGVQVFCIAGDGGQYSKTFNETGISGIKYLVSGINNSVTNDSPQEVIDRFNTNPDSVLILKHNITSNSFIPEFIPLKNL